MKLVGLFLLLPAVVKVARISQHIEVEVSHKKSNSIREQSSSDTGHRRRLAEEPQSKSRASPLIRRRPSNSEARHADESQSTPKVSSHRRRNSHSKTRLADESQSKPKASSHRRRISQLKTRHRTSVAEESLLNGVHRKFRAEDKLAPTPAPPAYVFDGKGVAGPWEGGELWGIGDAQGKGVEACYLAVLQDHRCTKDYFTYVARGDQNCGCKGVGRDRTVRDDFFGNADMYKILAFGPITVELDQDWKPSSSIEKAHVFTSTGAHGNAESLSDLSKLGWRLESSIETWPSDAAYLWNRNDECILAFRGSDDVFDFINDAVTWTADYKGVRDVQAGLITELGPMVNQMYEKGYRELIARKCTKSFVLAGYSLGGGLAQLLAAIINANHNPLGWTRGVDAVYVIGSIPVSRAPLANDQRPDKCFRGKNFFNAEEEQGTGLLRIDPAYFFPNPFGHMLNKHTFLSQVIMQDKKWHVETSCGKEVDATRLAEFQPTFLDGAYLHTNFTLYIDNVNK